MLYQHVEFFFFFFKQKTAYEMLRSLVGSEMCIRDRLTAANLGFPAHPSPWLDPFWRFCRQKRWHYTSLVTDQLLLGFAVADISYVSEVFVYAALRNRKGAKLEKGAKFEYMSMSPLALGVRMAPASTQGCTEAKDLWGSEVRVCAEEGGGWKVSLDVRVRCAKTQAPGRLSAEFGILPPVEPLSLLIPLRGTEGQLGYTMKAGGLKAIGRVLLLSLIHI
eukprot:TRINITY_DN6737_c0_g2_i2.p1 TRINITY_DN6737_c0_g2~~TRINITY_DN6737_c0_g2_i2.p1  ORF type:complete len:220 (-),score=58.82 TRINITY_DN6737_c0_g2_i2:2-661(-)